MNEFKLGIFALIKLIMLTLYSAHICAIILYKFENWEKEQNIQYTWIDLMSLNNSPWHDKYIAALYFSVITMITVGFGDIYPVNTYEFILIIIITLISCGVFAYCINSIGQIIQSITQKGNDLQNQLSQLTTYMKMKNIQNRLLQIKIKQYYEYLFNEEHKEYQIGEKIISELVGHVKREVMVEIYGQILKQNKFFYLNFSKELIDELSQQMQQLKIAPQNYIHENSKDLYCILSGTIQEEIFYQKGYKTIRQINKDETFNEKRFFQDFNDNSKFIAQNVVQVSVLRFDDFYEILKKFPKDREMFFQFKDYFLFNKSQRGLEMKCEICNSYKHRFINCPQIFFVPKQEQILYKYNSVSGFQKRSRFYRNQYKSMNCLNNSDKIRDDGVRVIVTYSNLSSQIDLIYNLQDIQKAHLKYINYSIIQNEVRQQQQAFQDEYSNNYQNFSQNQQTNQQIAQIQRRESLKNSLQLPNNITNSQINCNSQVSAISNVQENMNQINNQSQNPKDIRKSVSKDLKSQDILANNSNNNQQNNINNNYININNNNNKLTNKSSNLKQNSSKISINFDNNNNENFLYQNQIFLDNQQQQEIYELIKKKELKRQMQRKSSNFSNVSQLTQQKLQNSIILESSIDINALNQIRTQTTKLQNQRSRQLSKEDKYIIQEPDIINQSTTSLKGLINSKKNTFCTGSPFQKNYNENRNNQRNFSSIVQFESGSQQNNKLDQSQNKNIKKKSGQFSLETSSSGSTINYPQIRQDQKKNSCGTILSNLRSFNNKQDFSMMSFNNVLDDNFSYKTFNQKQNQNSQYIQKFQKNNEIEKNYEFSCVQNMDKMFESQTYFYQQNYYFMIKDYNKLVIKNLSSIEQKTNLKYQKMLKNNKLIGNNCKLSNTLFLDKKQGTQILPNNIKNIKNTRKKSSNNSSWAKQQNSEQQSQNQQFQQQNKNLIVLENRQRIISLFANENSYPSSKIVNECSVDNFRIQSNTDTDQSNIILDNNNNQSMNLFLELH